MHAFIRDVHMFALIIGEASASSSASARLPVIFASEICPYPLFSDGLFYANDEQRKDLKSDGQRT